MSDYIFVYGNSKEKLLKEAKAEYVCKIAIPGRLMQDVDTGTPFFIGNAAGTVPGELYLLRDATALALIDKHEDPYRRVTVHPISIPSLNAWTWNFV
jgi:Gamma-glutamyl cyclotransferase, AIG2-like